MYFRLYGFILLQNCLIIVTPINIKNDVMAIKRSELIDPENAGYYHLISRCVRRAFLCGQDPETKQNYDYRRQWIEDRIIELAEYFAIEVFSYAVMHNHYHLVVYSDPKAPESWSDLDVADKWLKVFPGQLNNPKFKTQRDLRMQAIVKDPKLLATYRERLGSLSWLMRRINEPLAKTANAEDFCKGHFWESRFKSQALLDEGAALTCMAYVDLNPIRANMATSLEESEHTSIKKRLESRSENELNGILGAIAGKVKNRTMVLPLKDYIQLVEWTGQAIVYPNKSKMTSQLSSTLAHLNIQQENWLGQVQAYGSNYYRFVGSLEKIKDQTKLLGQKWIKGLNQIQKLYIIDS
ncbi:MAG: REP element-mobilizing transposase RayT [Polaribacter sp.]|jgi:REP element-mobilizing transposase RayT